MQIPKHATHDDLMTLNTTPGHYYVTVIDGDRYGVLAGPFDSHAEALSWVDDVSKEARKADPKAFWYAYGTAKIDSDKPGVLNSRLGI